MSPERSAGDRRYEIVVGRVVSGGWTARCYDHETGNHVWSSENAGTVGTALRELAEAIDREERSS